MIQFKLNGKQFSMPTSWDEVKYKQFLKTFELTGDDNYQVVSIFTDIDVEILKNAEIIGADAVLSALSFAQKPMQTEGYCPKVGNYALPNNGKGQFNIQFETLAQFEDMRALTKNLKDFKQIAQVFPKFVAIYVQKIRDGHYDYSKAMEMESEVMDMPAKEVMITGGFFLLKLRSLLNGTAPTSQSTPPSPKKSKPVSKSSRKRSGSR